MSREVSEFIKYHSAHGLPSPSFFGAASARAIPIVCSGVRGSTFPWFRRILSVSDERLLRSSPRRPTKQTDVLRTQNRTIADPPPRIHPSQESLVIPTSDCHLSTAVGSQFPSSDPPSITLPSPQELAKKWRQGADADNIGDPIEFLEETKASTSDHERRW
jgi:hypothetical protein